MRLHTLPRLGLVLAALLVLTACASLPQTPSAQNAEDISGDHASS